MISCAIRSPVSRGSPRAALADAGPAAGRERALRVRAVSLLGLSAVAGVQRVHNPRRQRVSRQRTIPAEAADARTGLRRPDRRRGNAGLQRRWRRRNGAREVYACATHGLLCGPDVERLRDDPLKQLVLTDSIPLPPNKQLPNIKVLSVAPLLADAIKRIHLNESVSKLFE